MPWNPIQPLLATHAELENFTHAIEYYEVGLAAQNTYYTVRITPQQVNPNTVSFVTGAPGVISGFYKGIFNDSLTTRSEDGTISTISTLGDPEGSVFEKVNKDGLSEVIAFNADTDRSRTFTYLAEAITLGGTVVASTTYTIQAQDLNWTPGQLNLKELVSNASGNTTN